MKPALTRPAPATELAMPRNIGVPFTPRQRAVMAAFLVGVLVGALGACGAGAYREHQREKARAAQRLRDLEASPGYQMLREAARYRGPVRILSKEEFDPEPPP